MLLSDGTIRALIESGRLTLGPLEDDQLQPSSVDVRLGDTVRVFRNHTADCIDPMQPNDALTEAVAIPEGQAFILHPGEFVLGTTVEEVGLPDDLVARVEGKSSLGRIGLLIHATAGFVDPGFRGQLTLELSNVSRLPIKLWAGMKIGQLSFMALDKPAERPYGHADLKSKYQDQRGPMASQYERNYRD